MTGAPFKIEFRFPQGGPQRHACSLAIGFLERPVAIKKLQPPLAVRPRDARGFRGGEYFRHALHESARLHALQVHAHRNRSQGECYQPVTVAEAQVQRRSFVDETAPGVAAQGRGLDVTERRGQSFAGKRTAREPLAAPRVPVDRLIALLFADRHATEPRLGELRNFRSAAVGDEKFNGVWHTVIALRAWPLNDIVFPREVSGRAGGA